MVKQPAVVAPTPAVIPPTSSMPMEVDNEDSMDAPPSLGSTEGIVPPTTPAVVKKVSVDIYSNTFTDYSLIRIT